MALVGRKAVPRANFLVVCCFRGIFCCCAFFKRNPFFGERRGFCDATPGLLRAPRGLNWRAHGLFFSGGGMSKTGSSRSDREFPEGPVSATGRVSATGSSAGSCTRQHTAISPRAMRRETGLSCGSPCRRVAVLARRHSSSRAGTAEAARARVCVVCEDISSVTVPRPPVCSRRSI